MADTDTFAFSDPDSYAAGFGGARINLTITGAGDFAAKLTRLKPGHLEVYRCYERLPRIAYVSLPAHQVFLSFPIGKAAAIFDGFGLRRGDVVLHARGGRMHQRFMGRCQWGLISISPEQLANSSKALIGRTILSPRASRVLRPPREDSLRLMRLFGQACELAEAKNRLIERLTVARALEQEMLHAIVHCLDADGACDDSKTRHHHAAIMSRFEKAVNERGDRKITLPALCAAVGVPERTLRMCCFEFTGVSPMRYLLLQRLNKARSALRRSSPSTTSVAEVARNHQFLEPGRFAVTYRATFGESPSTTLQRSPQT